MATSKIVRQISFTVPNKVGQLSVVTELISAANVNMEAILALESGATAEFRIITGKNAKVKKALLPLGVEIREEEVIRVQMANKAGRLRKVAKKLAEAGVNVSRAWGISPAGKSAIVILQTSDDKKALELLKK